MIQLKVTNIKGLKRAIEKYGNDAIDGFDTAITTQAYKMAEIAKLKAPKNNGTLFQSIEVEKESELNYNVYTNEPYAPYMEFGTGVKVKVPSEFKEFADKAKGKKGEGFAEGLEDIKKWCKDKGIDVSLAYIIFVNILNKGLTPRPFMYPAYLAGKKTYAKQMKLVIKDLNNKFNNG